MKSNKNKDDTDYFSVAVHLLIAIVVAIAVELIAAQMIGVHIAGEKPAKLSNLLTGLVTSSRVFMDRLICAHVGLLAGLIYLCLAWVYNIYKRKSAVSDARREAEMLRFLAEHDDVTGLLKRKLFDESVTQLVSSHIGGAYFMIALDVEKFKLINDRYDFIMGDELLRLIAKSAKSFCDKYGGCVTRLFADKFAICLPFTANRMLEFIDYMNRAIEDAKLPYEVNFDCGVYKINDVGESVDTMIDKASIAEKTVKDQYLERFAVYDNKLREELLFEKKIVDAMSKGLLMGEFELYIQPQIDYRTSKIASGEALVRWVHEGKMISPSVFVPIFEKNGFIVSMDRFIWEETCKLLRKIRAIGLREIPLSINLSRMDLLWKGVESEIFNLINKYEIPPQMLRLEVTESAYVEEADTIIPLVKSLQMNGFTIEIDDFGSGYSSLNVLRDMPADILKTDLKFLYNYDEEGKGAVILSNVMRMSRELNMDVVAEGVETAEQADFLNKLGCNIMQGYYYSKPIGAEDFLKLLEEDKIMGDINSI